MLIPKSMPSRGLLAVGGLIALTAIVQATTQGESPPTPPEKPPRAEFRGPESSPLALTGRLDRTSVLREGDRTVKMELTIKAPTGDDDTLRQPTDFLVVLDRSGSMKGTKIRHARAAVNGLMERLSPQDRFALVSYSDGASVDAPLEIASDTARRRWRRTVQRLDIGGNTNMSAGLDTALRLSRGDEDAARPTRLLLISDGLANRGDRSKEGLVQRAKLASQREIATSTIGVGDDFDEFLMGGMADAGTGNFYYVEAKAGLERIFAAELAATQQTYASAVEVFFDTPKNVTVVDAAGYPLSRKGHRTTFRPGPLFAGQKRRIWVTFQVPNGDADSISLGSIGVTYKRANEDTTIALTENPRVTYTENKTAFFESIDNESWADAVLGDAYNKLQVDVAELVKAGRKKDALNKLESYRQQNSEMNRVIRSDDVTANLREVDTLEEQVKEVFDGPNQQERSQTLVKKRQSMGRDGRRPGSKY